MSLNYDPTNPFYVFWNSDSQGHTVSTRMPEETAEVHDGMIVLKQIPDLTANISIINQNGEPMYNMTDSNKSPSMLADNEYMVLDRVGFVVFNPSQNNKHVTVTEYFGKGYWLIDASRILADIGHNPDGTLAYTPFDELFSGLKGYRFIGEYQSNFNYAQNNMVFANGSVYVCLKESQGKPVNNTDYWAIFAAGLSDLGVYSATKIYLPRDVVSFDNGVYICLKKTTPGIPPFTAINGTITNNTAYWMKMVSVKELHDEWNGTLKPDVLEATQAANDAAKHAMEAADKLHIKNGKADGSLRMDNAEGESDSYSLGQNAMAVGSKTKASGKNSLAAGELSSADGDNTVAMGEGVKADAKNQTALGKYNEPDDSALLMIGNGSDAAHLSNAVTVGLDGSVTAKGVVEAANIHTDETGGFAGGTNAATQNGGGAIGTDTATQAGAAIGNNALSVNGGAAGNRAQSENGGAVGSSANVQNGGAVGSDSRAYNGGAIGGGAKTGDGFAGGKYARTVNPDNALIDAIQLGIGTNPTPKTLQVYDHQLLDANGNIPMDRIPQLINKAETSTENGGFEGGLGAETRNGAAVGQQSTSVSGGAAGCDAKADGGGSVGEGSETINGGAVGSSAKSTDGGAIGAGAQTTDGFAGGKNALAGTGSVPRDTFQAIDAIQLGTGQNKNEKTLQVYDKQLLDANGRVPQERLLTESGGFAMGKNAVATNGGIAIGESALTNGGFAAGKWAQTHDMNMQPIDAIQLGTGVNVIPNSLNVYQYQLLDEAGKIPLERLLSNAPNSPFFAYGESTDGRVYNVMIDDFVDWQDGSTMLFCPNMDGRRPQIIVNNQPASWVEVRRTDSLGGDDGKYVPTEIYQDRFYFLVYFEDTFWAINVTQPIWEDVKNKPAVTTEGGGFAGGTDAKAVDANDAGIDAIQLGTGTNTTPKTLQVYEKQIVSYDSAGTTNDDKWYIKDVGKLSGLLTGVKDNIVAAINEIVTNSGGGNSGEDGIPVISSSSTSLAIYDNIKTPGVYKIIRGDGANQEDEILVVGHSNHAGECYQWKFDNGLVSRTFAGNEWSTWKSPTEAFADGKSALHAFTTTGSGSAYAATVSEISSLQAGMVFVMKPHTNSTSTTPTLNINGLGAKNIYRDSSSGQSINNIGSTTDWLNASKEYLLVFNGSAFYTVGHDKPVWSDILNKPASFTPNSHASSSTTYGVGSSSNYGHVKLLNNLVTTSSGQGALDAYQGKLLQEKKLEAANIKGGRNIVVTTDNGNVTISTTADEAKKQFTYLPVGELPCTCGHTENHAYSFATGCRLLRESSSSNTWWRYDSASRAWKAVTKSIATGETVTCCWIYDAKKFGFFVTSSAAAAKHYFTIDGGRVWTSTNITSNDPIKACGVTSHLNSDNTEIVEELGKPVLWLFAHSTAFHAVVSIGGTYIESLNTSSKFYLTHQTSSSLPAVADRQPTITIGESDVVINWGDYYIGLDLVDILIYGGDSPNQKWNFIYYNNLDSSLSLSSNPYRLNQYIDQGLLYIEVFDETLQRVYFIFDCKTGNFVDYIGLDGHFSTVTGWSGTGSLGVHNGYIYDVYMNDDPNSNMSEFELRIGKASDYYGLSSSSTFPAYDTFEFDGNIYAGGMISVDNCGKKRASGTFTNPNGGNPLIYTFCVTDKEAEEVRLCNIDYRISKLEALK